jgi:carboxylesterase type B
MPGVQCAPLFLLLACAASLSAQPTAQVVQTTLGSMQGVRKTANGRDVDVYYGIPFAKPPVGDLRFRHPVKADPWQGVLDATSMPNACHQVVDTKFSRFWGVEMWNPNTPMSEDCLYLNVWVPRGFGSQPPRATMVWIFGGGFWAGSATLAVYDGTMLAATENVIVVTVGYRLGPLGFLYTGTSDAPGNQGLMDQAMALQWVYDNVVNLGGARETITIFGESAGAASVGLHLLSPLSRNYFARAIMQSASPTVDWGVKSYSQATTRSRNLAEHMGCSVRSIASMVRCLQTADAANVTEKQWLLTSGYVETPFAAVVDGSFLPAHPVDLLARGQVKDTEVLMGVNKDEGIFWLMYGFEPEFPFDNAGSLSRELFRSNVLPGLTFNGDRSVQDALLYEYADKVPESMRDNYRDIADDISGDQLFKCPVVNFATAYANQSSQHDVYLYSFEYQLTSDPWPRWTGVKHGYEIEAVFGLPLLDANYTLEDMQVAARVTAYWTRFAQTG